MLLIAVADGGRSSAFVSTLGLPLPEVAKLLRGPPGSVVALSLASEATAPLYVTNIVELHRSRLSVDRDGGLRGMNQPPLPNGPAPNADLAFAPSHASSKRKAAGLDPDFVIPDLKAWSEVKVGLTAPQVEKLLGPPLNKTGAAVEEPGFIQTWIYGYVARKSDVLPEDLSFLVGMESGKVRFREDPFGGVPVSKDGSPTKPKLMTPPDGTTFDHYPRFVDCRWYGSSGDYPMTYEIEFDTQYRSGEWSEDPVQQSAVPYFGFSHAGANRGRWRVRAINVKGSSEWSDYRYFTFTR